MLLSMNQKDIVTLCILMTMTCDIKLQLKNMTIFSTIRPKNLFIFLPRRKAIKDKGVYELKLNIDFDQSNFLKQFKHIHMLLNLNFLHYQNILNPMMTLIFCNLIYKL